MPEILLSVLYLGAVSTGFLFVAAGLYPGPAWIAGSCAEGGLLCQHPYLTLIGLFAIGVLYRIEEARERRERRQLSEWRRKFRSWLT
jgi:hypothetical protein